MHFKKYTISQSLGSKTIGYAIVGREDFEPFNPRLVLRMSHRFFPGMIEVNGGENEPNFKAIRDPDYFDDVQPLWMEPLKS